MAKTSILNLFARSPIRPLQQHMATVERCVESLVPFFEAVIANDQDRVCDIQEAIARAEDEADDQKHELRMHLPRSLFLPVERRDLLEVLTMQDNIANRAKDIAGLMRGRQMEIPPELHPLILEFVRRSVEACMHARLAVDELDSLVEAGFRGPEVSRVQNMIAEVDRIEKQTDDIQIRVRAELRQIEQDMQPLDAMFLYRVIDWIGDLGDRSQRVGSRLQLMLAH